jgi:hypothetical protein
VLQLRLVPRYLSRQPLSTYLALARESMIPNDGALMNTYLESRCQCSGGAPCRVENQIFQRLAVCQHSENLCYAASAIKLRKPSKKKLPERIGSVLIVRSLKNRARFAIRQKERLKDHVHMLHPPELRSHVIREVNSDLARVDGRNDGFLLLLALPLATLFHGT